MATSFCCSSQHSNFRASFTGGSELTIQKLNSRKNAACFAMAAWPTSCLKCFWVLQNDLTLYSEFAEAMRDEKHWLSYFLLFVLNFFTANVDSTVHFKAMASTWHFLYKFCSLRLLKFLCGMTNNILIKSSFSLCEDWLWRLVLLALLQLTFLHSQVKYIILKNCQTCSIPVTIGIHEQQKTIL